MALSIRTPQPPLDMYSALEAGDTVGADPGDGEQLSLGGKNWVDFQITPAAADETREIMDVTAENAGTEFTVTNIGSDPFDIVDSSSETILTITAGASHRFRISATSALASGNVLLIDDNNTSATVSL